MELCAQCPRQCQVNRQRQVGFCGMPEQIWVARVAPHFWEEPCISGKNGSGAVFLTGCNLHCVYCQNREISQERYGKAMSPSELIDKIAELAKEGVHNLNLVTGAHYLSALLPVLRQVRETIGLPVVWNSSGYESVESLKRLAGLVDVFLPDFKYASPELSARYSGAPDYPGVAREALACMVEMAGPCRFDESGMLVSGVLVRHLVLPGCRKDSFGVLDLIKETVGVGDVRLSLLSQYVPDYLPKGEYPELNRRVTTFEYESVVGYANRLGFSGYRQQKDSASAEYRPDFIREDRFRPEQSGSEENG